MPARLVALDEGPDIPLDRTMVVVGRHPQCDARLDSLRVSRHHCCMTHDSGDVVVRDLGSTNGIRINGQRVEVGRLRTGDELCIAHIRYRLESGQGHDATMAESNGLSALRLPLQAGAGVAAPPRPMAMPMPLPVPMPIPMVAPGSALLPPVGPPANGEPRPSGFDNRSLERPLAAMTGGEILPPEVANKCRIQIIVQLQDDDRDRPKDKDHDPEGH